MFALKQKLKLVKITIKKWSVLYGNLKKESQVIADQLNTEFAK